MKEQAKKNGYPLGSVLRRMLRKARQQAKEVFWIFGAYTLAAAVYPFLAVGLSKVMLGELEKGAGAQAQRIVWIAVGYFALAGALGFIRTFMERRGYEKLSFLRLDYVRSTSVKVMEMAYFHAEDAQFMEKYDKAFIATQSNTNGVEGIYHNLFEMPAVLLSIGILGAVVGRLSLWVLLGLGLNLAAILFCSRKSQQFRYEKRREEARQRRRVDYYNRTVSDFTYGKDIRMYGLKERILENASQEIEKYRALNRLLAGREYRLGFLCLGAALAGDLLTYGLLIWRTLDGMPIADFSMYLTATLTLAVCLKQAAQQLSFIAGEGIYVHEMYRFLDEDMGEKGGGHPAITGDTLEIVFDDVSFRYPGTKTYIFRHLNLTIQKGEHLAVVGINGAGKTTLVKLMMGLFDVTEGEIRINGIPIGEFDKKALYSMFSAVFQDISVMAFTVRENVAGRTQGIDDARVARALEQAGLSEAINALPEKTEQMLLKVIDEQGTMLSGGQNQKLAIARALYKDACMVVMDEPTAALDALAEAEIYEDLNQLIRNKTAVYISHRLASTRFCDHIALFDGNGLAEYGTHEELMAKKGSYYEMFTVQGKYYTQAAAASNQETGGEV